MHQPKSPQPQPQPPPFGLPYPPFLGFPPQPPYPPTADPHAEVDPGLTPANAYEAAQHILKAINFGGLFKIAEEEKPSVGTVPETPSTDSVVLPTPAVVLPTTVTDVPDGDPRAELQAMLALLAAQLAEVVHADDDDGCMSKGNDTVASDPPPPAVDVAVKSATRQEEEEEEDSDGDMEEVI